MCMSDYSIEMPDKTSSDFPRVCVQCRKLFPDSLTIRCPRCGAYFCDSCSKLNENLSIGQQCQYCEKWLARQNAVGNSLVYLLLILLVWGIGLPVIVTMKFPPASELGSRLILYSCLVLIVAILVTKFQKSKHKWGNFVHPVAGFKG